MAQTELEEGANLDAENLAMAIIDTQKAEVAAMPNSSVVHEATPQGAPLE